MGTYYSGYSTYLSNNLDDKFDRTLQELSRQDMCSKVEELKKLVSDEEQRREKDVNMDSKIVNYYTHTISQEAHDILEEMAKEDHVSMGTEIENAISGWYRFRHGFTGLEEKDKEIRELQNDLLRAKLKEQQDRIFSSLKTPPTYLETGHK